MLYNDMRKEQENNLIGGEKNMEEIKLENLPELKGSAKQIEWANDIRKNVIQKINYYLNPDKKLSQDEINCREHDYAVECVKKLCTHPFNKDWDRQLCMQEEKVEEEFEIQRDQLDDDPDCEKFDQLVHEMYDRMYYELAKGVIPARTDARDWIQWLR